MNSLFGGLLGGVLVGLTEGAVHMTGHSGIGPSIFSYGMVMYGFFGLLFGLGLGLLLGVLGLLTGRDVLASRVFSFGFASFFALNFLVIGRFRVYRDVLHERAVPMWLNLVILLVCALAFFVIRAVLNRIQEKPGYVASKMRLATVLFLIVLFIPIHVAGQIYNSKQMSQEGELQVDAQAALADKPNIIFIIIDTLRADYLGCYGFDAEDLSPNLDALGADGAVYLNSFAQASYTKPSIASLMTSLYVSTHNTVMKPDALPGDVTTLAEALRDRGYYTVGYANNPHISSLANFHQGYDEYYFLEPDYFFNADRSSAQLVYYSILRKIKETVSTAKWVKHYYQDASIVNEYVLDRIGKLGEDTKFFMFLHYMDTHDPYFEHPENGKGYARVSMEHPPADMAPEFRRVYRGEVVHVDQYVGELVEWLKANRLYDNTAIVVTSDHGEEFYEHQGWWHGQTLYNEQINVPLIIKYPHAINKGIRPEYQVQAIDVMPTLLHLAGAEMPPVLQGVNLLAYDENENVGMEYVYSEENLEGNILVSVQTAGWKMIRANEDNPRGLSPVELYDMTVDKLETRDVAAEKDSLVSELDSKLSGFIKTAAEAGYEKEARDLDDAAAEQLRALGYVQ